MYTLFLDTHDVIIRVALIKEEKIILKEQYSENSHSIYLVPMIYEIMKEANIKFSDIKNVVAVNGPGSFTGIRIGLSAAKAISYSLSIPIYLISSLTAILVSYDSLNDKMAIIPDNKGYYISVFDRFNNSIIQEVYVKDIEEYKNKYEIARDSYDVLKIVNYTLSKDEINVYNVKANYVKTIEVMDDRK